MVCHQSLPRGAVRRVHRRRWTDRDAADAAGGAARLVGCPGDRPDQLRGPGAGDRRGPGYLPDRLGDAEGARRAGGARLLVLRRLLRLHHLRGRHRPLLGAQPRAGVPVGHPRKAPPGRRGGARAGCHGPGVGFPVRAGGHGGCPLARRPPFPSGLVPPLPAHRRPRCQRSRFRRRLREDVRGDARPDEAAGLRGVGLGSDERDPVLEPGRGRDDARPLGTGVHGARSRVSGGDRGHRERRRRLHCRRYADPGGRCGDRTAEP